nr:hypothetical protein EVB34_064 [Rhizobium phage RHph_TM26]
MTGYEQMAEAPLKGDNILAAIAQTARDIVAQQEAVERAEAELKKAQNRLKDLQETTMVDLMNDAGQTELTTVDGYIVSIKETVRGQPTKENAPAAYKWLRDKKHGGIIKSTIQAQLGKVDEKLVAKALAALSKLKIQAGVKEEVHWQTLGALVRELLDKGENIPLDLLGVQVIKGAVVKPKKS